MSTTKVLHTTGMHCKSCEMMVREAIEEIDGCKVISISSKTGKVTIDFSDESVESQVREVIRSLGYKITDEGDRENTPGGRFDTKNILWLFFAGLIVLFLSRMDISGLTPAYEKVGFGIAFLVGLVASVSTCLAVTGGIIIGYTESIVDKTNGWNTQLRFHMGRIIAFTLGGFVLGMIGQTFSTSVYFNGILSIFVGFVLAYLGAQLLGILPNISRIGITLPLFFTRNITRLKDPKHSPWVGALTLLLPCGFTQSMMIYALSTHDAWQGAIVMGGFALGTLPVLLALGLGTEYIKDHLRMLNPLIASFLLIFGISTMTNGYKIIDATGQSTPQVQQIISDKNTTTSPDIIMSKPTTTQIVWSHDGYGFFPRTLNLKVGERYTVTVTPESDGRGCFYSVIIPGKGEQYIKKGEKFTININGSTAQSIPLVCGSMGMSQGRINVE